MARRRRFIKKNSHKRKIVFSLLLVCFLIIGIGFANLSSHLEIQGSLGVQKYHLALSLYDVLKDAAEEGTYAKEYTGTHQDSFDNLGHEKIYHWYGADAASGTAIVNKNNVIFANHCWQMIRTTDTGGVKMIYNGEAENNQCLNTRGTHEGPVFVNSMSVSDSYYYGTGYDYDNTTKMFTLTGNIELSNWNSISASLLRGKYTCKSTSPNNYCSVLYKIIGYYDSSRAAVIQYESTSHYSQYGTVDYNSIGYSLASVGYMYNLDTLVTRKANSAATSGSLFGGGVNYSDGKYTLTNISSTYDSYHHYTCNNTSGECSIVRYYYHNNEYVELNDGRNIETVVEDMLYSDDLNQTNSTIKEVIDGWYEKYLYGYGDYLEDTIFCNNRRIYSLGGWNPNGGGTTNNITFYSYYYMYDIDIGCTNETDKFSILNPKARLNYKIGLMTSEEMWLLQQNNFRSTGQAYWLGDPIGFMNVSLLENDGSIGSNGVSGTWYGVRPAISLKSEIGYVSGDGSMANPYIVEAEPTSAVLPTNPDTLRIQTSNTSSTFGKDIARSSFESITIVNHTNVPNNVIDSWDVSNYRNGSVMAWYKDEDSDGKYELYIGQEGGVKANIDSSYTFNNFTSLESIDLTYFNTSNVVNMNNMFSRTGYVDNSVFTLDLGPNFDTSSVIDMSSMFYSTGYGGLNFTLNLRNIDTSKVINMANMFYNTGYNSTKFELDLGNNFDTSKVTTMSNMFNSAGYASPIFTLNLGDNFDTSKVVDMSYMFRTTGYSNTSFTLDLGNHFNTSKVTNMSNLFWAVGHSSTVFILDLGNQFDTSNVTNMSGLFCGVGYSNPNFTLNLGNKFDTSKVTNMNNLFDSTGHNSTVFTLDLSQYNFDTSNVVNMNGMFFAMGYSNPNFTLNLGNQFNTSKVTTMQDMFREALYNSSINGLDLSQYNFDTSNVINMAGMFYFAGYNNPNFTLNLGNNFNTAKVTNMSDMFHYTGYKNPTFTLELGNYFNTSKVTNMSSMFQETGYSSTVFTLDLGNNFNTAKVTNMSSMFSRVGYANANFELDISTFVFTNVSSYLYIFSGFRSTNKIWVKDTAAVTWIINNSGNSDLTTNNIIVKT